MEEPEKPGSSGGVLTSEDAKQARALASQAAPWGPTERGLARGLLIALADEVDRFLNTTYGRVSKRRDELEAEVDRLRALVVSVSDGTFYVAPTRPQSNRRTSMGTTRDSTAMTGRAVSDTGAKTFANKNHGLLYEKRTKWKPLLAAAKKLKVAAESAAEAYTVEDAPDPDLAGTYIVATTEYERLDELLDAAVVCHEAIAKCGESVDENKDWTHGPLPGAIGDAGDTCEEKS